MRDSITAKAVQYRIDYTKNLIQRLQSKLEADEKWLKELLKEE